MTHRKRHFDSRLPGLFVMYFKIINYAYGYSLIIP